jgi:hypothetical protein
MMVETMQIHDGSRAAEGHNPFRALGGAKDEVLLTAHSWDSSTITPPLVNVGERGCLV